jgi:hypothetical protein
MTRTIRTDTSLQRRGSTLISSRAQLQLHVRMLRKLPVIRKMARKSTTTSRKKAREPTTISNREKNTTRVLSTTQTWSDMRTPPTTEVKSNTRKCVMTRRKCVMTGRKRSTARNKT